MFGVILFGISSILLTSQAGLTSSLMMQESDVAARGAAISFKEIFGWQGALSWLITGAIMGAVLDDKPATTPTA